MKESEFGRGYATCLRQFVNHRARLNEMVAYYARQSMAGHNGLFSETSAVEMWANGASDHLYDLVRPRRGVPAKEWTRAKQLQERALDIGHGFGRGSGSSVTEAHDLLDTATLLLVELSQRGHGVATLEAAMDTDQSLGLKPQRGSWSCAENAAWKL